MQFYYTIFGPISSEIDWFEDEYGGKVEINPHVEDPRTSDMTSESPVDTRAG